MYVMVYGFVMALLWWGLFGDVGLWVFGSVTIVFAIMWICSWLRDSYKKR